MCRAFSPSSSFNISLTLTHSWFPLYLWPCSQFIYQWCQYLSKPPQISNNTIEIELAKFIIWLFITAFRVMVILSWSFIHIFWFQKNLSSNIAISLFDGFDWLQGTSRWQKLSRCSPDIRSTRLIKMTQEQVILLYKCSQLVLKGNLDKCESLFLVFDHLIWSTSFSFVAFMASLTTLFVSSWSLSNLAWNSSCIFSFKCSILIL